MDLLNILSAEDFELIRERFDQAESEHQDAIARRKRLQLDVLYSLHGGVRTFADAEAAKQYQAELEARVAADDTDSRSAGLTKPQFVRFFRQLLDRKVASLSTAEARAREQDQLRGMREDGNWRQHRKSSLRLAVAAATAMSSSTNSRKQSVVAAAASAIGRRESSIDGSAASASANPRRKSLGSVLFKETVDDGAVASASSNTAASAPAAQPSSGDYRSAAPGDAMSGSRRRRKSTLRGAYGLTDAELARQTIQMWNNDAYLENLFADVDFNGDGTMSLSEYTAWAIQVFAHGSGREFLLKAFKDYHLLSEPHLLQGQPDILRSVHVLTFSSVNEVLLCESYTSKTLHRSSDGARICALDISGSVEAAVAVPKMFVVSTSGNMLLVFDAPSIHSEAVPVQKPRRIFHVWPVVTVAVELANPLSAAHDGLLLGDRKGFVRRVTLDALTAEHKNSSSSSSKAGADKSIKNDNDKKGDDKDKKDDAKAFDESKGGKPSNNSASNSAAAATPAASPAAKAVAATLSKKPQTSAVVLLDDESTSAPTYFPPEYVYSCEPPRELCIMHEPRHERIKRSTGTNTAAAAAAAASNNNNNSKPSALDNALSSLVRQQEEQEEQQGAASVSFAPGGDSDNDDGGGGHHSPAPAPPSSQAPRANKRRFVVQNLDASTGTLAGTCGAHSPITKPWKLQQRDAHGNFINLKDYLAGDDPANLRRKQQQQQQQQRSSPSRQQGGQLPWEAHPPLTRADASSKNDGAGAGGTMTTETGGSLELSLSQSKRVVADRKMRALHPSYDAYQIPEPEPRRVDESGQRVLTQRPGVPRRARRYSHGAVVASETISSNSKVQCQVTGMVLCGFVNATDAITGTQRALISLSISNSVGIFDCRAGCYSGVIRTTLHSPVKSICLCERAQLAVFAGVSDRKLSAASYDVAEPKSSSLDDVEQPHHAAVVSVCSPEGTFQIVSIDANGVLKIWDARTFRLVSSLTMQRPAVLPKGTPFHVFQVVAHHRRAQLIALSGIVCCTYQYDPRRVVTFAHEEPITHLLFNPVMRTAVSVTANELRTWSLSNGRCLSTSVLFPVDDSGDDDDDDDEDGGGSSDGCDRDSDNDASAGRRDADGKLLPRFMQALTKGKGRLGLTAAERARAQREKLEKRRGNEYMSESAQAVQRYQLKRQEQHQQMLQQQFQRTVTTASSSAIGGGGGTMGATMRNDYGGAGASALASASMSAAAQQKEKLREIIESKLAAATAAVQHGKSIKDRLKASTSGNKRGGDSAAASQQQQQQQEAEEQDADAKLSDLMHKFDAQQPPFVTCIVFEKFTQRQLLVGSSTGVLCSCLAMTGRILWRRAVAPGKPIAFITQTKRDETIVGVESGEVYSVVYDFEDGQLCGWSVVEIAKTPFGITHAAVAQPLGNLVAFAPDPRHRRVELHFFNVRSRAFHFVSFVASARHECGLPDAVTMPEITSMRFYENPNDARVAAMQEARERDAVVVERQRTAESGDHANDDDDLGGGGGGGSRPLSQSSCGSRGAVNREGTMSPGDTLARGASLSAGGTSAALRATSSRALLSLAYEQEYNSMLLRGQDGGAAAARARKEESRVHLLAVCDTHGGVTVWTVGAASLRGREIAQRVIRLVAPLGVGVVSVTWARRTLLVGATDKNFLVVWRLDEIFGECECMKESTVSAPTSYVDPRRGVPRLVLNTHGDMPSMTHVLAIPATRLVADGEKRLREDPNALPPEENAPGEAERGRCIVAVASTESGDSQLRLYDLPSGECLGACCSGAGSMAADDREFIPDFVLGDAVEQLVAERRQSHHDATSVGNANKDSATASGSLQKSKQQQQQQQSQVKSNPLAEFTFQVSAHFLTSEDTLAGAGSSHGDAGGEDDGHSVMPVAATASILNQVSQRKPFHMAPDLEEGTPLLVHQLVACDRLIATYQIEAPIFAASQRNDDALDESQRRVAQEMLRQRRKGTLGGIVADPDASSAFASGEFFNQQPTLVIDEADGGADDMAGATPFDEHDASAFSNFGLPSGLRIEPPTPQAGNVNPSGGGDHVPLIESGRSSSAGDAASRESSGELPGSAKPAAKSAVRHGVRSLAPAPPTGSLGASHRRGTVAPSNGGGGGGVSIHITSSGSNPDLYTASSAELGAPVSRHNNSNNNALLFGSASGRSSRASSFSAAAPGLQYNTSGSRSPSRLSVGNSEHLSRQGSFFVEDMVNEDQQALGASGMFDASTRREAREERRRRLKGKVLSYAKKMRQRSGMSASLSLSSSQTRLLTVAIPASPPRSASGSPRSRQLGASFNNNFNGTAQSEFHLFGGADASGAVVMSASHSILPDGAPETGFGAAAAASVEFFATSGSNQNNNNTTNAANRKATGHEQAPPAWLVTFSLPRSWLRRESRRALRDHHHHNRHATGRPGAAAAAAAAAAFGKKRGAGGKFNAYDDDDDEADPLDRPYRRNEHRDRTFIPQSQEQLAVLQAQLVDEPERSAMTPPPPPSAPFERRRLHAMRKAERDQRLLRKQAGAVLAGRVCGEGDHILQLPALELGDVVIAIRNRNPIAQAVSQARLATNASVFARAFKSQVRGEAQHAVARAERVMCATRGDPSVSNVVISAPDEDDDISSAVNNGGAAAELVPRGHFVANGAFAAGGDDASPAPRIAGAAPESTPRAYNNNNNANNNVQRRLKKIATVMRSTISLSRIAEEARLQSGNSGVHGAGGDGAEPRLDMFVDKMEAAAEDHLHGVDGDKSAHRSASTMRFDGSAAAEEERRRRSQQDAQMLFTSSHPRRAQALLSSNGLPGSSKALLPAAARGKSGMMSREQSRGPSALPSQRTSRDASMNDEDVGGGGGDKDGGVNGEQHALSSIAGAARRESHAAVSPAGDDGGGFNLEGIDTEHSAFYEHPTPPPPNSARLPTQTPPRTEANHQRHHAPPPPPDPRLLFQRPVPAETIEVSCRSAKVALADIRARLLRDDEDKQRDAKNSLTARAARNRVLQGAVPRDLLATNRDRGANTLMRNEQQQQLQLQPHQQGRSTSVVSFAHQADLAASQVGADPLTARQSYRKRGSVCLESNNQIVEMTSRGVVRVTDTSVNSRAAQSARADALARSMSKRRSTVGSVRQQAATVATSSPPREDGSEQRPALGDIDPAPVHRPPSRPNSGGPSRSGGAAPAAASASGSASLGDSHNNEGQHRIPLDEADRQQHGQPTSTNNAMFRRMIAHRAEALEARSQDQALAVSQRDSASSSAFGAASISVVGSSANSALVPSIPSERVTVALPALQARYKKK